MPKLAPRAGGSSTKHAVREKHVCTLPISEDDLVIFISEGHCVIFRRWFRRYFVIDSDHRYTRSCFKSLFIIQREKRDHLRRFYYMIHPFSKAKRHYDVFVAVVLLISISTVNQNAANIEMDVTNIILHIIDAIGDMGIFFDIIRNFITGYYIPDLNVAVLEPKKVAINYLKTWLIWDMFAIIPEYAATLWQLSGKPQFDIVIIKVFEITRVVKYLRIINIIDRYNSFTTYKFRAFRMLTIIVMVIIWISFVMEKVIANDKDKYGDAAWYNNENHNFVAIVHRSFLMLFLLGVPDNPPTNGTLLAMDLLLLQLGYFFYLYSTVQFYQMVNLRNASLHRYELMKTRLYAYANYKNVPAELEEELIQDFESRFHNTFFNEEMIMNTVSGELGRELREFLARKFQEKFELLNYLSIDVVTSLTNKMQVKTYVENSVISKAGTDDDYIYFIYQGTAAVYSKEGVEITHLHDGTYFGEIRFLKHDVRTATVTAVETCRIYRLEFQDLKVYAEEYPDLFESIVKLAESRLRKQKVGGVETVREIGDDDDADDE